MLNNKLYFNLVYSLVNMICSMNYAHSLCAHVFTQKKSHR